MPTYVLEGSGRAVFATRPLVASMTVTGASGDVKLEVIPTGDARVDVVRPTPTLAILPRIVTPVVLRLVPAPGIAEFPLGTEVHLALTVEDRSNADPDPDRAVLGPIAVGGEKKLDVVTIEPSPEGLVIAALRAAPDVDLGEVGNRARSEARALAGVDQLPEADQVDLRIAVDPSVSMLPVMNSGLLAAACDVVVGVAAVVSPRSTPRFCIATGSPGWIETDSPADVPGAVVAALRRSPMAVGFASASVAVPRDTRKSSFIVVISDAVPADWPEPTSDSAGGPGRHLLVAAKEGQAVPDARPATTTVMITSQATPPTVSPESLRSAVAGLVAQCGALTGGSYL
ncbi:hypothetical protein [Williamsia sp. M5A3_1d]